jgi:hypothetical protein
MKFRDLLLEVTSTGSKVDREEYSKEKKFIEIKKLLKLVKSHDEYSLYKYYDYLFLSKNDDYVAHIDGTTDTLFGKKSVFITVSFSKERGSMKVLLELLKKSGYKYTISDTMLSDDAVKYYKKLILTKKYFIIDEEENVVKNPSEEEIFNNPNYRIVIQL